MKHVTVVCLNLLGLQIILGYFGNLNLCIVLQITNGQCNGRVKKNKIYSCLTSYGVIFLKWEG